MSDNKMLDAALQYAAAGLAVIPLRGKQPICPNGVKNATTDPAQITEWFSANPNANIGIAAGQCHGKTLVVVDLDVGHTDGVDGTKTLAAWEAANGKLPKTLTVKTGSGGYHLYFFTDTEKGYKNGTNILKGFDGEQSGIDTRCSGGYLVAPPSVHPTTGGVYEWIEGFDVSRIADGGEVLDKLLTYRDTKKNTTKGESGGWKSTSVTFSELIDGTINKLGLTLKEGSRNDNLYKFGCSLQGKGLSDDQIMTATIMCNETKCSPPLKCEEVEKIVESVLKNPKGKEEKEKLPPFTYEGFVAYIEGLTPPTLFRLNEVTRDVETFGREENDFLENVLITQLVREMKPHFNGGLCNNLVADYISLYAYEHRYNPVVEQIDGAKWDGIDRLTQLYAMLGIIEDELSCVFVRKWLMEAYCGLFNTKRKRSPLTLFWSFRVNRGSGKRDFWKSWHLGILVKVRV